MKKIIQYFFALLIISLTFGSCKASKGCGLTSDASTIEQTTNTQNNTIVAIAK
jgi:hypothetical protein